MVRAFKSDAVYKHLTYFDSQIEPRKSPVC